MTTGEDPDDEHTRTLAVPPLLWPDLVAWLQGRGLRVERIPMAEVMGAPVYFTLADDPPPDDAPSDSEASGEAPSDSPQSPRRH